MKLRATKMLFFFGFLVVPAIGFAASRDIPLQISILSHETVTDIAQYISIVYQYLVGLAGLMAVGMIMYAGMKWIFAGGDKSKITAAHEIINHAVIGLVLALGSYLILNTINPELIALRVPEIRSISRDLVDTIGCFDHEDQETCELFKCIWADVGDGQCAPKADNVGKLGGACEGDATCPGGSNLTCIRARGQNLCTDRQEGSVCGSTSDCIAELTCGSTTRTCFLDNARPLGESCSNNEQCQLDFCYGGRCTTQELLVSMCRDHDDCETVDPNTFCPYEAYDTGYIFNHQSQNWRQCQQKQEEGKPCCSNEECVNGDCEGGSLIGCNSLGKCN